MSFTIRRTTYADKPEWLRMRHGLWPEAPSEYLALDLVPGFDLYLSFTGGPTLDRIEQRPTQHSSP